MNTDANRAAIVRAAQEMGVDPTWALAVADRESGFSPTAHADKSIYGMFQMTGNLRAKHGAGDSTDPYTQARAFMSLYQNDIKPEMRSVLGRDPTDAEAYAGHHFGAVRAARMISRYSPDTPVDQIFSPREMSLNPHFAKAGTSGNLINSITADIGRRQAKFGGQPSQDYASAGDLPDFSSYGTPADDQGASASTGSPQRTGSQSRQPDFSSYGTEAA